MSLRPQIRSLIRVQQAHADTVSCICVRRSTHSWCAYSMRSGDLGSSLEPPASVFAPQSQSQQRRVPVADLQHLLGVSQPDGSSNLLSGFSSALMPRPSNAKEPEPRSDSASGNPRPKSVRFGDAVPAAEEQPPGRGAASLEEPNATDFENAQVSVALRLLWLGTHSRTALLVP